MSYKMNFEMYHLYASLKRCFYYITWAAVMKLW